MAANLSRQALHFDSHMQPWTPVVYCAGDGFFVLVAINLIQFAQLIWFMMNGAYYAMPRNWLSYIVWFGHAEALLVHMVLSQAWPDPAPDCDFVREEWFESRRQHSMPSRDTQLTFALITFIIGHFILTNERPAWYIVIGLISLPVLVAISLWITSNATFAQIAVGAVVGLIDGFRRVILYEAVLNDGFKYFARRWWIVKFLMPDE